MRKLSSATKNPTMSEPASPIKILAGGKLNNKNPNSVPTKTRARPPTRIWPLSAAATKRMELVIAAMPAEAPSMLSRKLKALMIRTIQAAERTVAMTLLSMKSSTRISPKAAARIATAN